MTAVIATLILVVAPATRAPNASIALERAILRLLQLQRDSSPREDSWATVQVIQDLLPLFGREKPSKAVPES